MNRRQWKKASKKAVAEIERRRPGHYEFVPARGDETVYAPRGYEPPCRGSEARLERRYASPPKGTPVVWLSVGYETDEWDCYTALEILEQIEREDSWKEPTEQDMKAAFSPSFDAVYDEMVSALWFVLQKPENLEQVASVPAST